MANQELHHRQLRIGHMHSSVKLCRSIKDRNRLWKVGVRDLVRDICCALHNSGFVFPVWPKNSNVPFSLRLWRLPTLGFSS
jgi:hypothetical protein